MTASQEAGSFRVQSPHSVLPSGWFRGKILFLEIAGMNFEKLCRENNVDPDLFAKYLQEVGVDPNSANEATIAAHISHYQELFVFDFCLVE